MSFRVFLLSFHTFFLLLFVFLFILTYLLIFSHLRYFSSTFFYFTFFLSVFFMFQLLDALLPSFFSLPICRSFSISFSFLTQHFYSLLSSLFLPFSVYFSFFLFDAIISNFATHSLSQFDSRYYFSYSFHSLRLSFLVSLILSVFLYQSGFLLDHPFFSLLLSLTRSLLLILFTTNISILCKPLSFSVSSCF